MENGFYVEKVDYLIFVDFDGVLTNLRMQFGLEDDAYRMWTIFDPAVIEFFNRIHRTYTNVRFVWTTTWRNNITDEAMTEHWAYSMWYNAGFRGFFGTPWRVNPYNRKDGDVNHADRAAEIKHYLENYGSECKDYLIFDDSDYGFNKALDKKRFIRTHSENGMTFKNMLDAWSLTGNWERKDGKVNS